MAAEGRVQELIGQLRNFRTRSSAADELVAVGREAVLPLVEALRDEEIEGAVWTMLNCLGELGDPRAVPALAPYLERSDFQAVAHEALVKITGKNLGPLPGDWLRWVERWSLETGETLSRYEGAEEPADVTNARLMELALEKGVAQYSEEEQDRYVVQLPLAGGGVQEVTVVFGGTDHEGGEIVIVYSDCGKAREEHYEGVLRRNLRMPYGAIALRDIRGEPYFVMFNTILRHALSPIELRKSIFTIGERANQVARQFHQD
jgi:hypothetical protein